MISLIIFGIIALIVVTLLLTFNIRSFNKPVSINENHPKTSVKLNQTEEILVNKPADEPSEKNEPKTKDIPINSMSDQQYRSTLRQYSQGKKSNYSPKRQSDEEYRAALRSMRSPKK